MSLLAYNALCTQLGMENSNAAFKQLWTTVSTNPLAGAISRRTQADLLFELLLQLVGLLALFAQRLQLVGEGDQVLLQPAVLLGDGAPLPLAARLLRLSALQLPSQLPQLLRLGG